MRAVDQLLLFMIAMLAVVAFLNHGKFGIGTDPSGAKFNVGYGG